MSSQQPNRGELQTAALIAALVGASLTWLSLGDRDHPVRPALLVVGIAAFFASGWPLVVPRPDDDASNSWWNRGAVGAVLVGIGLGIACALALRP